MANCPGCCEQGPRLDLRCEGDQLDRGHWGRDWALGERGRQEGQVGDHGDSCCESREEAGDCQGEEGEHKHFPDPGPRVGANWVANSPSQGRLADQGQQNWLRRLIRRNADSSFNVHLVIIKLLLLAGPSIAIGYVQRVAI